jgi:hypothetical protein
MRYLVIALLAGCAIATPINDGQHLIECDGSAVPWSTCFKKAANVCPNGYTLVSQNTEKGPYSGVATNESAVFAGYERKNIVVKCRLNEK